MLWIFVIIFLTAKSSAEEITGLNLTALQMELATLAPETDTEAPKGWNVLYKDTAWLISQEPLPAATFTAAKRLCLTAQGHIFGPINQEEATWLGSLTENNEFWIDIRQKDTHTPTIRVLESGKVLPETWSVPEGDCFLFNTDDNSILAKTCTEQHHFLCTKKDGPWYLETRLQSLFLESQRRNIKKLAVEITHKVKQLKSQLDKVPKIEEDECAEKSDFLPAIPVADSWESWIFQWLTNEEPVANALRKISEYLGHLQNALPSGKIAASAHLICVQDSLKTKIDTALQKSKSNFSQQRLVSFILITTTCMVALIGLISLIIRIHLYIRVDLPKMRTDAHVRKITVHSTRPKKTFQTVRTGKTINRYRTVRTVTRARRKSATAEGVEEEFFELL